MELSLESLFFVIIVIIIMIILYIFSLSTKHSIHSFVADVRNSPPHSLPAHSFSLVHYFFFSHSRPLHYIKSNYVQRKKRVSTIQQWTRRKSVFSSCLSFFLFCLCVCVTLRIRDKLLSSVLFSLCMVLCYDFIFFCIYTSVYRNHSPIFVAVVVVFLLLVFMAYLLVGSH